MKSQGPKQYLLALVGHPVTQSLSPPMHLAALKHCGLKGQYRLIDLKPEDLLSGVNQLKSEGYTGFNVTVPHKASVFALCDELSLEAEPICVVNTVKIDPTGRLIGHNTDVGGFMRALTESLSALARKKVAYVMGAGGAARAAVWGLVFLGWPKITIVARNTDAANLVIEEVRAGSSKLAHGISLPQFAVSSIDLSSLPNMPDLVVNATSIGWHGDEIPDWATSLLKWISPQGLFFDMVYATTSKPTLLIRQACRLRLACLDGSEMLLHQAGLAFEFWTGKRAPLDIMREALMRARVQHLPTIGE